MRNRIARALAAAAMSAMLCVSLASPVSAAQSLFGDMEAKSRQAVEAAIKAGSVPAGTTIYDCAYGADANGNTIVIQYRDKDGKWVDVVAGKTSNSQTDTSAGTLTEDDLKSYADDVFKLVNQEREKAGLTPLERDAKLDSAAAIRAEELSQSNSHTRPDGTPFYTVMGVEKNYYYGENIGHSAAGPQDIMQGWMNSDSHRAAILGTKWEYIKIGIAVYQADDGSRYWCQLFSLS